MMVNIMFSDCGDLLLSLSEAMLYPKQAHLFSFELFLVVIHTVGTPSQRSAAACHLSEKVSTSLQGSACVQEIGNEVDNPYGQPTFAPK